MLHLNYSPTRSEVKFVASHLRKQEVDELGVFLASPTKAILESVEMSHGTATVITPDGLPIAICGVVPMDDDTGMLWVMSTEKVKAHSLTLTSEVLTNKELGMEYLVFEMITTKGLNDLFYKSDNIEHYKKLHNLPND